MAGRVEGKVAFVTGAARGQGRSHALRLAQEGADIIAVDIEGPVIDTYYPPAKDGDLAETVRQVEALDRRIIATKVDVRDRDAMQAAVDKGVGELGKLDIVVANAGICVIAEWEHQTQEIWDKTIGTNLTGVWNTVMVSARHLIDNGGGSIVMTSSTAGLKGLPFLTAYVAAKHGVVGLMRTYASELAKYNIRVNTVHPTGVNTDMGTGDIGALFEPLLAGNPRVGGMLTNTLPVEITEPVDISNAVLFLASDEARYVTSVTFPVDAGNSQY